MVRRSAFEAIGGFDEREWMYGEDLDLCWRLADAGYRVRYVPQARVAHVEAAATAAAFGDERRRRRRFMAATYRVIARRRSPPGRGRRRPSTLSGRPAAWPGWGRWRSSTARAGRAPGTSPTG